MAVRLRRSDCSEPGLTRRRRGKGFEILDPDGATVRDPEVLARVHELVIPPAWHDVWICPYPGGHIQATGIDQKGRKQYLYHPRWRARRDAAKFDDMCAFARLLPALRDEVARELARDGMDRDRVLAAAVRLLDRGFFRIGSEDYAAENASYGLATMRRDHVTVRRDGTIVFDYPAKSGKRQVRAMVDQEVSELVTTLKRRRGGGEELLAYRGPPTQRGRWRDVRSDDINEWLKERTGQDVSAKDFRTWGATVLAAVALAVSGRAADTRTARKRAVTRAIKEVAHYLGNTPAVARASYVDPRVLDRFRDGLTIGGALDRLGGDADDPAVQGAVEEAVLDLIGEGTGRDVEPADELGEAA